MPVLDETYEQSLQYRQLRKHPKFARIWNTSYANELDELEGICAFHALLPWAFGTLSNTLAEPSKFVGIGGAPDSGDLGVFAQLSVL